MGINATPSALLEVVMRVIRPAEAAKMLGISEPTLWRYSKSATFPAAFRLGPNAVGFDEGELIGWLESRRIIRPEGEASAHAAVR